MKQIDKYDENLKQVILELPFNDNIYINSEGVFIPVSNYGFAEIYRIYDDILVFLIPPHGGIPQFHKCYSRHNVDYLIKELREMC